MNIIILSPPPAPPAVEGYIPGSVREVAYLPGRAGYSTSGCFLLVCYGTTLAVVAVRGSHDSGMFSVVGCLAIILSLRPCTNIPTECPGVVPTAVEGAKAQDPQTSGGSLYHLPPRTHVVSVYCIILLIRTALIKPL